MAENKKSFVLYTDIIEIVEELNDAEAGLLFKTILRYVNDQNPVIPKEIKLAFIPIKQDLKRDLKRYEERCKKNQENARKRWDKEETDSIGTNTTEYNSMQSHTNAYKRTKSHSDNDNDNDSDNDNESDNDSVLSYDNVFLVGIFNHWNSKPSLIHHKKMSKAMEEAIQKALSTYKYETILQSIDRYVTVLDSRYSFNYRWSIDKFMERGVSNFTDDGSIWNTYVEQCKKNPFIQPQTKQEVNPAPDFVQDFIHQLK